MYFFKYHPLKEILKNRELTDRQALPYIFVFMGLTAFFMSFPLLDEMNGWDYLSGFLSVILSIAGVYYAYLQNGGAEGYDFIQKYIVLGWVVSVRVLLISIPIFFVAFLTGDFLGLVEDTSTAYDVIILAAFEVILYQRIGRHIRDTKTITSEPFAPPDTKGHAALGVR
jgi:hypothetical protein